MDIDGIEPGVDFVKALDEQVAQASAFIAVIGPGWTDLKNAEGQRRLDQPNDHVRIEIKLALKRDIRVIPGISGWRTYADGETNCLTHLNLYHAATRSCLVTTASAPKWMIWRGRYSALWGCSQNHTATYAFAAGETPTPSWIEFLFSFEGRISRKSYWLSGLAIVGVSFLFLVGISAVLGKE